MGSIIDHDSTARRRHQHRPTEIESGGSPRQNNKLQKKNRRRRKRKDDVPFYQIFLSVAVALFLTSGVLVFAYRRAWPQTTNTLSKLEYDDDDDVAQPPQDLADGEIVNSESKSEKIEESDSKLNELWSKAEVEQESEEPETPPPLPTFELSKASKWDAFGILETFDISSDQSSLFWNAAKGLRRRFAETYGGENAARMILDRGLTTFFESMGEEAPLDIINTACRFQRAEKEMRPFRFAFAGYSVTAGRGNLFEQSFPFQMQNLLNTVVQLAGITQGLQVRNAAIGGIPAFPYGWCFENFLGLEADVISWDYAMNEAGGVPEGLESYVRHILTTYSSSLPKLIVKDTHLATLRRGVLHDYAELLLDTVTMHTDPAAQPFLERVEEHRPIGFQEWRKFGAPYGAPGQAHHHPAVKEHEMMGWILAMHFLTALEYKMSRGSNFSCPEPAKGPTTLPPPVSGQLTNNTNATYDSILFGHETSSEHWKINPVQCRTTFQPMISGDLSELIVNGSIAEDMDILLPKSQMFYNDGWVLDMSEGEKGAKRKLSLYENNLGFLDSKEAYYGIFESPELNLLLPYSQKDPSLPKAGDSAKNWYQSIVICRVNEKRDENACNFGSDISMRIGGVNATNNLEHLMKDAGTLYLGKPVCSHIPIPEGATLTSHNELSIESELERDQVGLLVQIFITNQHIVHISQACSVSHVVWEEKKK